MGYYTLYLEYSCLYPTSASLIETDSLHLAIEVKGLQPGPIYLPDSYDVPQPANEILQHFDLKKGIHVVILQTLPPISPEEETTVKKRKPPTVRAPTIRTASTQAPTIRTPKIKQEAKVKVKLEPRIKQETSPVRSISRKRSFSVALKDADTKALDEATNSTHPIETEPDRTTITPGSEEEEVLEKDLQELLDTLTVPKEEDRVAYRTRRRHILQQEDIDRSAEFGVPILAKRKGST
ncbi:hypothetical protein BJX63DRAFT_438846 [Aspergillus granulosus]|uniref:Uncharacterized protein n=1 Tax=Aspergillus granulosus TaxID=176169 RepID=A0ABR4GQZ4_9EURO